MTAVEVVLILIGVVFLLGSFFITEKLTPTEISRVAELSEEELRIVMNRELETAGAKISDMADQAVDLSMNRIQRTMEKDSNEKIMAISEYSDTVMEQLKKMNSEVTFLYSMLGDKHEELRASMAQLTEQMQEYQALQSRPLPVQKVPVSEASEQTAPDGGEAEAVAAASVPETVAVPEAEELSASSAIDEVPPVRDEILERYRTGEDLRDIARALNLGYGEVKLIVELYKGEENL